MSPCYNLGMNVSLVPGMAGLPNSENSPVMISNGQTIRITVLKDNGDGTSLVSFGGGKFNIKSDRPLLEGQVFNADVSYVDGKVHLSPLTEPLFSESFVRFMESSNLVPDGITARLLQFMEQSGARIDRKVIHKARAVGLNFAGREKAAAEIACMLMEKGIEPDEETVRKLLSYVDAVQADGRDDDSSRDKKSEDETDGNKDDDFAEENFLDDVYSVLPCRKSGLLGFLNHFRNRNSGSPLHWMVLPYEWKLGDKAAGGFIRLLLNTELKSVEKVQINCKISCKNYYFVLYYNESKVKEVRFCSLPPLLTSEIANEEKRLGELFCSGMNGDSVPVTYSACAYSEGLYSSSEIPFSFEDIV